MKTSNLISRRKFALLLSATSILGASTVRALSAGTAQADQPREIQVYKSPTCGCCHKWDDIMSKNGFKVVPHDVDYEKLEAIKKQAGIPEDLASCHTAVIDGYAIEGHVPPAEVARLLKEHPDAIGLSVPGMPMGSPGMETEDEGEPYDVLLVKRDGSTEVYKHYDGTS